MAEIINLGPVGFNPTGNYDNTRSYEKLDMVLYYGSSYVAKQSVIGQLPTNSQYWDCVAIGTLKQFTYDSVAEMKLDNSLEDGMYAFTGGYYSVNDGGGATYKITSEKSETEHQEELNNNLYATLIVESPLNVKKYGAKGDNINDDTNIIQWIFNYATSHGEDIYFPSGIYKITAPITVNWGLTQEIIRPKIQKIYGSGSQTFESRFDSTVLMGYNIPANRGIIELIGEGNTWGPNTIIEDLSIYQDENTCNTNSFCLFYGDSHQFELNKVKLYGFNNVLVRCGSNSEVQRGYAGVNTRYINTAFKIFNSYSKGFSILPERIITSVGHSLDNLMIENCIFEGVAVIDCVLFNLVSSHIALRMAVKDKTSSNIGLLNGHEIDYSTGLLLTHFSTCNIKSLYCEDYRRAIDVLPLYGVCGNLIIDSCYFNALSNQFDSQNNRLLSDYGVITRANSNQSTWVIQNMTISNCIFRQVYPSELFQHYAIENNIATQFENVNNVNFPSFNDLNINEILKNGFHNKPLYYNRFNETYSVKATNLGSGKTNFKFDNDNTYIKALHNSYLTRVELYFDTPVPDNEDFTVIIKANGTTQAFSCAKTQMTSTSDKKVWFADMLFRSWGAINSGDEIEFYIYSVTLNTLLGKTVYAKFVLNV